MKIFITGRGYTQGPACQLKAITRRCFTLAHHEMAPPSKAETNGRIKLTGRAFYESLGSPRMILAPMVDQSEFV